jgi:hypothetical protein
MSTNFWPASRLLRIKVARFWIWALTEASLAGIIAENRRVE